MHIGYTVPGVVTGKPIALGGSEGRNEATARGTVYCIEEAARHLHSHLDDATVVVQGFGNAGLDRRAADGREGREDPGRLRLDRRHPQPGRPGHQRGSSPGRPSTARSSASPAPWRSRTPRSSRSSATSSSRRRWRTRSPPRTRSGSRPRSWPRPQTARRRPRRTTSSSDAGCSSIPDILCNAGGVTVSLLRVGPGPQPRPLEREDRQRQAARDHDQGLQRDARDLRSAKAFTCASPRTCWPSSASPTPPRCAASTRKSFLDLKRESLDRKVGALSLRFRQMPDWSAPSRVRPLSYLPSSASEGRNARMGAYQPISRRPVLHLTGATLTASARLST